MLQRDRPGRGIDQAERLGILRPASELPFLAVPGCFKPSDAFAGRELCNHCRLFGIKVHIGQDRRRRP